jgi:hypothetical protein
VYKRFDPWPNEQLNRGHHEQDFWEMTNQIFVWGKARKIAKRITDLWVIFRIQRHLIFGVSDFDSPNMRAGWHLSVWVS